MQILAYVQCSYNFVSELIKNFLASSQGPLFLKFNSKIRFGDQQSNFRTILEFFAF